MNSIATDAMASFQDVVTRAIAGQVRRQAEQESADQELQLPADERTPRNPRHEESRDALPFYPNENDPC